MSRQATSAGLVREIGLLDASMIVVGSMIGSGIFITSAESARLVGAPGWLLAAWAVAGLLTLTGALCCSELAAMMPQAGGQYVFLREAYGPAMGFLFGWSMFLVIQTGTIAAVAVAFARFLGVFVPWVAPENYLLEPQPFGATGYAISLSTQQLVTVGVISALTLVNTRGLKTGTWIQNTLTVTKTAALLGLVVVGLALGPRISSAAFSSSWWRPWLNGWSPAAAQPGLRAAGALGLALLFGKAMVGPLFSQSAWNNVTFTGGEVRNPGRTLPLALLLGCGTVVGLYLLANLAYVVTLPLGAIQHADKSPVAIATAEAVLGRPGVYLMAAAILVSTFGCVNGLILAGARVYYAMARDGLFFSGIGTANRHHVPAVALLAQGVWAACLVLPRVVVADPRTHGPVYGNVYNQLLEYIISADLCFYALMVGALIVMRRKAPHVDRPYRTPGHPAPALVYVSLATVLVLDLVYLAPATAGAGFAIVLTGIPAFFLWGAVTRAKGTAVPTSGEPQ